MRRVKRYAARMHRKLLEPTAAVWIYLPSIGRRSPYEPDTQQSRTPEAS